MAIEAYSFGRTLANLAIGLAVGLSAGCSVAPPGTDIHDPFEAQNRAVHAFNKDIDRALVRPVAQVAAAAPEGLTTPVINFSDNVALPGMVLNGLLQGDIDGAATNAFRFALNTTIGVLGLADPAGALGLTEVETDFGETLAVWGVPEGAYLELPLIGPSTERDAFGRLVDAVIDPLERFGTREQVAYGRAAWGAEQVIERGQFGDTVDFDSLRERRQLRPIPTSLPAEPQVRVGGGGRRRYTRHVRRPFRRPVRGPVMTALLCRRTVVFGLAGAAAVAAAPSHAISAGQARALVDRLVDDVNAVIASGASEAQMLRQFETIFDRYADVPTIARYVLGTDWRAASASQRGAFTQAYKTYVSRKYGRRFREFIGGYIEVVTERPLPRGVEVETRAVLRGQSPFRVDFHVEDSTGRPLFFNLVIEGVNMLLSERAEMQAQLDVRRGDLNRLIAELPRL